MSQLPVSLTTIGRRRISDVILMMSASAQPAIIYRGAARVLKDNTFLVREKLRSIKRRNFRNGAVSFLFCG
jgi:hypothetical protein